MNRGSANKWITAILNAPPAFPGVFWDGKTGCPLGILQNMAAPEDIVPSELFFFTTFEGSFATLSETARKRCKMKTNCAAFTFNFEGHELSTDIITLADGGKMTPYDMTYIIENYHEQM